MEPTSPTLVVRGLTATRFEPKVAANLADFEKVIENAAAQGIEIQEVAIHYEGLTDDELAILRKHQEVTHEISPGRVLAKFPKQGLPLYPEKATVHYLGA
jgi:hypothetical protein